MKSSHLIIGVICLIVNALICWLLTSVSKNTLLISSLVIATTSILAFLSGVMPIKNGFKVSLPFIFCFNGLVEYALSFFIEDPYKDNGYLVAIIALFAFQVIVALITYFVSKLNDEHK